MTEKYYLAAYWGGRKETLDACVGRTFQCLSKLADFDDSFSRWYRRDRSRKNAFRQPITLDFESLKILLAGGRNKRDFDGSVISELGFRVGLWNGAIDSESMGLNLLCGSYSNSPHIVNSFVINLPEEGDSAKRLLNTEFLRELIAVVVRSWEPEWAVVNSTEYRNLHGTNSPKKPTVGWLFYLASFPDNLPKLPTFADRTAVGDRGQILTLTEERFTVTNSEHIALANQLQKVLNSSKELAPTL